MLFTRRIAAVAVAVCLAFASPLLASPMDDFMSVVNKARGSPDPVNAFFAGFSSMGNLTVTGAEIKKGIADAGLSVDNPALAQILGNIETFSKRGDQLELHNAKKQGTEIKVDGETKGWVTLDKVVKIRLRQQGQEVVIDNFDGIELSKQKDSFKVSLKKVRFLKEGGKPKAKVTAGWGIFSKTVDVDMSSPDAANRSSSRGITSGVPQ
jgi:hypothetical protein